MEVIFRNAKQKFESKGQFEPDAFTLSAITASGNNTMTTAQKQALNTFFTTISAQTNSGIYAKLKKLYLPMICSNVSKALVNYKGNVVDCTPDASVFAIDNGGLKGIAETSIQDGLYIGEVNNDMTNSSFVMSLSDYTASAVLNRVFLEGGVSTASYYWGWQIQGGAVYARDTNPRTVGPYSLVVTAHTNKAFGMSLSGQSAIGISDAGVIDVKETEFQSHTTLHKMWLATTDVSNGDFGKTGLLSPISSAILGTALTQTELTTLKNAVDALSAKFVG